MVLGYKIIPNNLTNNAITFNAIQGFLGTNYLAATVNCTWKWTFGEKK